MKRKPAQATPTPAAGIAPSRVGRVQVAGYFDPQARRNLRMIQAQTDLSIEAQLGHALNLWFRANHLPTINLD